MQIHSVGNNKHSYHNTHHYYSRLLAVIGFKETPSADYTVAVSIKCVLTYNACVQSRSIIDAKQNTINVDGRNSSKITSSQQKRAVTSL